MRLITPKSKKFWSPALIIPSGGLGAVTGLTFQAFATEAAASTTSTYSSVNFGTAAANRVLAVIAVERTAATSLAISSMTIGGVSASQVTSAAGSLNTSSLMDIWYASVPTGTSGTISITWNNTTIRTGIYVYSILTSTPTPSVGSGTSGFTSTSLSRTITVPSSGFGIAGCFNRNTGNTDSMTNASIDGDNQLSGANHQFFCGHTTATGSITITGNSVSGANDMLMSVAAWSP